MNQEYWDSLKGYITLLKKYTLEGTSKCDVLNFKNQMLTRANTFQEILDVMESYENYKENDDET